MLTDAARPLPDPVTLRSLLVVETIIGTVINTVLNLIFAWLTFPVGAPVTVWGAPGLAVDLLPATLIPAFMMTLAVTTILRIRLRAGLRVVAVPALPFGLPRFLILRAVAVALLALVIVAAPTLAVLALAWPEAGNCAELIAYKLVFSVVHSAVLSPFAILAGLKADRR